MGNIGSAQINQRNACDEQWAHSFPRTQQKLQQNKVLPDRDSRQKLRPTNNGEILQSGGTISGRPAYTRSLSMVEKYQDYPERNTEEETPNQNRMYIQNQRDHFHKTGNRYTNLQNRQQNGSSYNSFTEQMKKFGSEPDLRYSSPVIPPDQEMKERVRVKKKYKAPPPPNMRKSDKICTDWDKPVNSPQSRKARLFKTQAESKNELSSPVNKLANKSKDDVQYRERDNKLDLRTNRLSLPEIKLASTIDFQEELKEATKRLRYTKNEEHNSIRYDLASTQEKNNRENSKLKTLDPNIYKKDLKKKLKEMEENPLNYARGEPSGKECSSEEKSPVAKTKDQPKTFYFGMDDSQQDIQNDIIDSFTSNLHPIKKISMSSGSELSSELEMDECQISKAGIDLQLRPMLPKKQLEIPRFSPAAAWKLLSSIDTSDPATSTIASDDSPVFIEDRIEKFSRPPPPTIQIGPRSSNDKSGDSGISGDAGPVGYDDAQENIINSRNNFQMTPHFQRTAGISWTPQQDLEDDSSLEEGVINHSQENSRDYQKKPHVFSLSLPRDNHLAAYMVEKNIHQYSGLQKLKRSVSGVLNNLSNNKRGYTQPNLTQEQNDNWFLSKSAPNSLNNVPSSLEIKISQKNEETSQTVPNSGRVMYLPDFDTPSESRHRSRTKDDLRERSRSADRSRNNPKLSLYSKSCESIVAEVKNSVGPENLQDPPNQFEWKNNRKPKKFTFQSTVRQIERRRLAEKLSREAERKENQRLRELEAMQKVEEEFQKKRAREKASIRQQLRLYSLDEPWSSLPPNIELKDQVPIRPEPDGAVSSTNSSPPLINKSPEFQKKSARKNDYPKRRESSESSEENKIKATSTQILSEFRQPHRDYKEFRANGRYLSELNENSSKHTTVHPQVTYNMPKAKKEPGSKTNGTNYRKDFAHGSSYSEESQSRNNSPRLYHNNKYKNTPITRF